MVMAKHSMVRPAVGHPNTMAWAYPTQAHHVPVCKPRRRLEKNWTAFCYYKIILTLDQGIMAFFCVFVGFIIFIWFLNFIIFFGILYFQQDSP